MKKSKSNISNIKPVSGDLCEGLNLLQDNFSFDDKDISDKTLLALKCGDHKAYQDIYYAYKDPIEYFLTKLLHSKEEAAELTQAIFVNVWEKRAYLDPTKSIKSYLFTIARNSATDFFKHLRVRDRYVNHEMHNDGLDYDSDKALIAEETRLLIKLVVSRMPPKRRLIFEMSRNENLTNEEIAKKLKMNKLTVASHIAQALKEVREVLALFYILFLLN